MKFHVLFGADAITRSLGCMIFSANTMELLIMSMNPLVTSTLDMKGSLSGRKIASCTLIPLMVNLSTKTLTALSP
jgi:hypothetical protein